MNQPTLLTPVQAPAWLPSEQELETYEATRWVGAGTDVPDEDDEPFDAVAANREYAAEWAARW